MFDERQTGYIKKVLIVYDSEYGATHMVAKIIEKTLSNSEIDVALQLATSFNSDGYDTIIVGSPIHVGKCSKKIIKLLKDNCHVLRKKPVAFFFTCMSVTKHEEIKTFPLFVDPDFNISNKQSKKMNFMEKNHTSSFYLNNLYPLIDGITPANIAFFKGNLNLNKLKFLQWVIMKFAMFFLPEVKEGTFVSQNSVTKWSDDLIKLFGIE
ncbi:MAG: flavodoxin domain-containing protein [Desulfobacula sp.]|nr:flavodoxin domain-containing protein [Desulfobacula sp.]